MSYFPNHVKAVLHVDPVDTNVTYSQSGTTVTVTYGADHTYATGNIINIDITSGTAVDGTYPITGTPSSTTLTYTAGSSLTTSGNATVNYVLADCVNIASVTRSIDGNYLVTMNKGMPTLRYAVITDSNDDGADTDYRDTRQKCRGVPVSTTTFKITLFGTATNAFYESRWVSAVVLGV